MKRYAVLRDIVAGYLGRGIRFFAFDIVEATAEKKTVQPLAYEFRCDHVHPQHERGAQDRGLQ